MKTKVLVLVAGLPGTGKTTVAAEIAVGLSKAGLRVEAFGADLQQLIQEDYCHVGNSLLAVVNKVRRYDCDVAILDTTDEQSAEAQQLLPDDIQNLERDGLIILPVLTLISSEHSTTLARNLAISVCSESATPVVIHRVRYGSTNTLNHLLNSCIYCQLEEFTPSLTVHSGGKPFLFSEWAKEDEERSSEAYAQLGDLQALVSTIRNQIRLISGVLSTAAA